MTDLTRYRRLPGYSTIGTDNTLPPGSYSSAVADWVPDTRLQAIADYMAKWREDYCYEDNDCVIDGHSIDMTEFWTGWDALVNDVT